MIGYLLTSEEREFIQERQYSQWNEFSCILDINNQWFVVLSPQDKDLINRGIYSWILECPQCEFVPPTQQQF